MQRDMDLVRQILITIADAESGWAPRPLRVDGYTDEQVGFHILLMIEGGLLVGANVSTHGGSSPSGIASRITWRGYEFLDAARGSETWNQAKGLARKAGGTSFQVLMELLTRIALGQAGP
jgi:hypothetical protein